MSERGVDDVDYAMAVVGDESYEWVKQRPEFLRFAEQGARGADSIEIGRGRVRPSDFWPTVPTGGHGRRCVAPLLT